MFCYKKNKLVIIISHNKFNNNDQNYNSLLSNYLKNGNDYN